MPGTTASATTKKGPTRRASRKTTAKRGAGRVAAPPEQTPAVEPVYRDNTGRLTPAQKRAVPTEDCLVQAPCGCRGMLLTGFGRLDGDYPYVAARIIEGCTGHPERVGPGVIVRFPPTAIRVHPEMATP